MAAKLSRYLGVQPFKTTDRHIFFGRDEDIENLHDFILLEKLVVLFGKSGYGKSSLLNAGIIPRLMDDKQPAAFRFRPIEVRFTTYIEGQSITPLETMKRLVRDIPREANADFLSDFTEGDTLWLQFKQRQTVANGQFVLIFDQFEELFSYSVEQQEVFRKQLAELFYTDIPQSVRAKLDTLSDEQRRYVAKPMNVKVVFAIRSDRMSLLDSMKDVLPAILHKRYELQSLTTKQARKAIVEPAKLEQGDTFASTAFEYTEGGLDAIIKALTTTTTEGKERTTTGIEAFQLQIVCEYIEGLVKNGKVPDIDANGLPNITEQQLPKMKSLYRNYYHRKLAELDESVREAAQRVLEDGLLAEDSATGEGRRTSVDSLTLISQFRKIGLDTALLEKLEKTYLIRREVNTVGGFSFEISHDTLVAPIQEVKNERKALEEKKRLEQEKIEKERQLAEAKRQAEIEEQKRKEAERLRQEAEQQKQIAESQKQEAEQQKQIAESQKQEAERQRKEAEQQKQIAIKERENADIQTQKARKQQRRSNIFATLASIGFIGAIALAIYANSKTNDATKALNKFKKAQFEIDLTLAKGQLSGGNSCLSDEIFESLQKTLDEFKDETNMKTKIVDLNKDIQKNNADCPIIRIQ